MLAPETVDSAAVVANYFAVGVFAVTGALVASRKEMDIFGFALLATVTGIGGGTVRDVMLGQLPVFWVRAPVYVMICLAAAAITFFTAHLAQSRFRLLLWLDAMGLALVSVVGADLSLAAGTGAFIAIVMGVITAAFGSIIRDVLGGESPIILRREIYVIPAAIGATVFVGLLASGLTRPAAMGLGILSCFTVRGLAIYYRWALPPYRGRRGRKYPETRPLGRDEHT